MTIGVRIGRAARVRAALANGALQYADLAEAIGEKSPQVKRALWQMKKQGFLVLDANGWGLTDKVPMPRHAPEDRARFKKLAKARWEQRNLAKRAAQAAEARRREAEREGRTITPRPKKADAPKPAPKPRPAKPAALRIVTNDLPVPYELTLPATPKHDPAETERWIAANPDKVEVLPAFGAPLRREDGPVAQKNRDRRAWNELLPRKRA